MDALLQLPRGKDAAETIQGLWHGHRVRQRVLRGGKPCCSALIADCLVRKLQPHQLLGVRWLYKAATRGGGILADDPGLGKTLQAIATIEALISSGWARRVFVVAPANLLANWQEEFRRWLGKTPAALNIVVAGAGEAGLCDKLKFSQLAAPMDDAGPRSHMLLLTSYESLASHGEPLRASIGVDLAVVDEAHRARQYLGSDDQKRNVVVVRCFRGAGVIGIECDVKSKCNGQCASPRSGAGRGGGSIGTCYERSVHQVTGRDGADFWVLWVQLGR